VTDVDQMAEDIFSDRLHEIWMKVIQQVTGGHPVLVGGAVEGYAQLVLASFPTKKKTLLDDLKALAPTHRPEAAAQRLLTAPAVPEGELDQLELGIRAYVEYYLAESRLPIILRSVHFIRSRYPQAAQYLTALAQDAEHGDILDYSLRQVLYLSGLAYSEGAAGQLTIPGSFTAGALRAVLEHSAPEPVADHSERSDQNQVYELRLSPKKGIEDEQGSLLVSGAGTPTEIYLSGIQWKILARLWREEGKPVTVEALTEELQASSKESVRTAIHWLKDSVREQGFESPLETFRGKGYYVKKSVRRKA
jgi:hypothetical protein